MAVTTTLPQLTHKHESRFGTLHCQAAASSVFPWSSNPFTPPISAADSRLTFVAQQNFVFAARINFILLGKKKSDSFFQVVVSGSEAQRGCVDLANGIG